MQIIGLVAENIKRLTAVEIAPNGAVVEITGRNGQGKTSVLDAIWWALAGATHIQSSPIRKDADEALIRLDLGTGDAVEYRVTRTFRRRSTETVTTSIVVENQVGARFNSPQKVLDALLGELSFDPLAFTRLDSRRQFEALKRFVPDVDFDAIEAANKQDYDRRTEVNRAAKTLRAQAAGIEVPAGAPTERIDEAELVAELERAGEHNAEIERRKAKRERAEEAIRAHMTARDDLLRRAEELRRQADELQRQAGEREDAAQELRLRLDQAEPLPDPIDTSALREKIAEARKANALVAARERRAKIEAEAAELEAQSAALTEAMQERDAEKLRAIEAAEMPVPGLSFGEGIVLLNGLPFDQASDAEQLRTSVAIAMAMNPKLKVIRVRDGSLLDDDAMGLLAEMAEAKGYQVWVETVGSDRPGAVVIEDGAVKGVIPQDTE